MSRSDEPAKIKAAILDSILADDLRQARTLLSRENPEELRLLAELLTKAENQTPPLMDLKARAPLYLSISASYTCGLRCEMCNSGFHDRTRLYEDYSYFLPEQFDALPEWNDSAKHVFFVGMGETLDSPHIPYFLKRLNGQMSTVITSGVPLNRRMIESLIESKLKILNLSFDGKTSAGHGGGRDSYIQKFWAKVESVQKIKKELGSEYPRITLGVTVNGENIGQLEEIFARAFQNGIREISLIPMIPFGEPLFNKSIFVDFEGSKKKINQLLVRWNKKGMRVDILGFGKTLRDSLKTCPYVDNWINFHGTSDIPKICCGAIDMPLGTAGLSKNQYWNTFPFRYFRYLHFCSEERALPIPCQNCWAKNFKKFSETCRQEYPEPYRLYIKASRLKSENRIGEAERGFREIARRGTGPSLKGKAFYHLGEIQLARGNYSAALNFMKQAVQHCFDHKMAFAYLYLLFALEEKPRRHKRRKKFHWKHRARQAPRSIS